MEGSESSVVPKTSESPPSSKTSKTPKTSESPPSRTSKAQKTSESPPPSRTSKTLKTSESPLSRTSKTQKTSESPPPSRTSKTPKTSESPPSSKTSKTPKTSENPPPSRTSKTPKTSESPPSSKTSKTPRTSESPPPSRTSKTPKTSESPPSSRTSKTPKTSESPPPSRTSKTPKTSESPPSSKTSKTPKTSESPPPSRTSKTPKTSESPPPSKTSKTPKTSESPPPSRTSKTPKTSESPPPSKTSKTPKTSESPPPSRTSKTPKTSESPPPSRTSKTPKTSESPPPSRTSKTPTTTSEPQNTSGGCQFKTSLCVLLKKHDEELLRSIEYQEKLEIENEKGSDGDDASEEETENGVRDGATDKKKMNKKRHKSVDDAAEDDSDNKKDMAEDTKRKKSPRDQSNEDKKEANKKERRDKADATKDKKRISKDAGKPSSQRTRDNDESKGKTNNRKDVGNEEKAKQKKKLRDKEAKDENKGKEKIESKENGKNKDLEENENAKPKDMEKSKEKLVENKKTEDRGKTEEKGKREKAEETKRVKGSMSEAEGKTEEDGATGDLGVETRAREATEEETHQKGGKPQGFLMLKKKGPFRSWKRYFFVLDGHLLTYYRSQQDFGHLSVLKGSLDLAMMEEVRVKKPGLMKTHFPFRLTRRNLPSLKLAADTSEDRDRWLGLLQDILLRSNRISTHNSDRTLHTGRPFAALDASDQPAKFATLPNRTISLAEGASSSSSDEGEDDTELKLIQAKRIPRIPIIGPLSGLSIAEVNLRKVEPTKNPDGKKQDADDTDSPSSTSDESEGEQHKPRRKPRIPAGVPGVIKLRKVEKPVKTQREEGTEKGGGDQTQREDPISAGEVFGVKLKKIQGKEGIAKEADAERKTEDVGANERRTIKQANIPLKSSNILSRPDVKLPKTSPLNQKKGTTERKKSPSPNIPLSKSVHSLTKAAEVGDASAKVLSNVSPENADSEDGDEEVKSDFITIRHAESSEIQCNDEVVNIVPVAVMEITSEGEDCATHELQEQQTVSEDRGQLSPQQDKEGISTEPSLQGSTTRGTSPPVLIHPMPVTVTEDANKAPEREEVDDEFLHSIRETADSAFPPLDIKPSSQEEKEYDEVDEDFFEKTFNIALDSLITSPQLSPPGSRSKTPSPTQSLKPPPPSAIVATSSGESPRTPVGKDVSARKCMTPPSSPIRARTSTNESMSSGKSESENVDKRTSAFKLFKTKRSGSITSNDRKEIGESKDAKDPKQKGSSTFSKILHGKRGKDKKKKEAKDDNTKPTEKLQESVPKSSEDSKSPADTRPAPDATETPPEPQQQYDHPDVPQQEPDITTQEVVTVVMRHNLQPGIEESRCSTYSRTSTSSRDQEPAPSIPEKTRIRAKSPNHDTPQSNRPVTHLCHLIPPQEQGGVEDRTLVDGYITEKQIQAILSANEIRGKKRLSQSRGMGNVLSVPTASRASEGTAGEDWNHKRLSINSTESDEPLHATNFLSGERLSSSSGSYRALSKSYDSDVSGESHPISPQDLESPASPEQDIATVSLRATPRLADSLAVGNRVSLTSPEFTVVEEDGPGTPDATKTTFALAKEQEEQNATLASAGAPAFTPGNEEDEQEDYFPVVGGDVELRLPRDLSLQNPSAGDMRTSGITGLKEYLDAIDGKDEELTEVKSSISRLGHSAAVEKLKETSNEL